MTDKINEAAQELTNSITQFDVGATIGDDDVKLWNRVIEANRELNALLSEDKRHG
jgi:hypothetical protein